MATTEKQWFVLRVASGQEDRVRRGLEARVKAKGIEDRVPRILVPTETVTEIKGGRKRTSGTGNPNRPLEERSRDELYNRARQLEIEGRSRMSKGELVRAIRKAG